MFELLNEMRNHGGSALTSGLTDEVLARFSKSDQRIAEAVSEAHAAFTRLRVDEPELLAMDETDQIHAIQIR